MYFWIPYVNRFISCGKNSSRINKISVLHLRCHSILRSALVEFVHRYHRVHPKYEQKYTDFLELLGLVVLFKTWVHSVKVRSIYNINLLDRLTYYLIYYTTRNISLSSKLIIILILLVFIGAPIWSLSSIQFSASRAL